MSERRRVGILFGGRSVEHEVSVISARGVVGALKGTDLAAVPLGVTAEGRWLSPGLSRSIAVPENTCWLLFCRTASQEPNNKPRLQNRS